MSNEARNNSAVDFDDLDRTVSALKSAPTSDLRSIQEELDWLIARLKTTQTNLTDENFHSEIHTLGQDVGARKPANKVSACLRNSQQHVENTRRILARAGGGSHTIGASGGPSLPKLLQEQHRSTTNAPSKTPDSESKSSSASRSTVRTTISEFGAGAPLANLVGLHLLTVQERNIFEIFCAEIEADKKRRCAEQQISREALRQYDAGSDMCVLSCIKLCTEEVVFSRIGLHLLL